MQRVDVREDARDRQADEEEQVLPKRYLVWEVAESGLPPGHEAAGPAAGCAASALPAWCPFFPAFCPSISSEPALNKTCKTNLKVKGQMPGWDLTCTAGDTPKRATDNVFVPVEEQSVNGIQVQIPKAVQGRNIFFYKSIKRNCFTTRSFLCDRHLAWNFQLSPVQLTAKQIRLCINISTVYPLSKDPSQLFP